MFRVTRSAITNSLPRFNIRVSTIHAFEGMVRVERNKNLVKSTARTQSTRILCSVAGLQASLQRRPCLKESNWATKCQKCSFLVVIWKDFQFVTLPSCPSSSCDKDLWCNLLVERQRTVCGVVDLPSSSDYMHRWLVIMKNSSQFLIVDRNR